MSEQAKWYVVHTYSGYENKVAKNIEKVVESHQLHDLILEVKIPTEMVDEIKDGKKKEVERKLFPSYVIIKMVMTDDSWYIVRNIRGVTGFVGPSSKPIPLTQKEVDALGVEERRVEVDYKVGDNVKIVGGSLQGFSGNVTKLDTNTGTVTVVVSILGRNTPVDLELSQVVSDD
ncbi:MAG: transcription termination/antitermination protein NusG [Oscillospiraceae bacterium]|nr:transcription termination/antitermination protein NusG [Oscillospiraceae bacterium]MDE5853265.1 transcription termination/antitermination protein NusG [Oscillospiraceae bacterium]